MGLENIKDEKVKKLAETLRSSGLAASDSEAERMASEMSSTADKVQRSYDEQEEKPEVRPTNTSEVVSRVENEKPQFDTEDSNLTPTTTNIDTEKIFAQQKEVLGSSYGGDIQTEKTVQELMDEDAKEVYNQSDEQASETKSVQEESEVSEPEPEVQSEPEPVQESYSEPESQTQEHSQSESVSESVSELEQSDVLISDPENGVQSEPVQQEHVSEPESEQSEQSEESESQSESEPEHSSEEKDDEEKESEADKMAESTIDLSDVFNFGKK